MRIGLLPALLVALALGCDLPTAELPSPAGPVALLDAGGAAPKETAHQETARKEAAPKETARNEPAQEAEQGDEVFGLSLALKKAWANDLRPNLGIRCQCAVEIVNRTGEPATLEEIELVVSSLDGQELKRLAFIHPDSCTGSPHRFVVPSGKTSEPVWGHPELVFNLPELPEGVAEVRVQLASKLADEAGPVSRAKLVRIQPGVWPSMKLRGRDGKITEVAGSQDRAEAARRLLIHLQDPDRGIRYAAAHWLQMIGPWAAEALPALTAALDDPDPDVREAAQRAIASIQAKASLP